MECGSRLQSDIVLGKRIVIRSRIWGLGLKSVPIWKWLCINLLTNMFIERNNQLILQGRCIMNLKGKL